MKRLGRRYYYSQPSVKMWTGLSGRHSSFRHHDHDYDHTFESSAPTPLGVDGVLPRQQKNHGQQKNIRTLISRVIVPAFFVSHAPSARIPFSQLETLPFVARIVKRIAEIDLAPGETRISVSAPRANRDIEQARDRNQKKERSSLEEEGGAGLVVERNGKKAWVKKGCGSSKMNAQGTRFRYFVVVPLLLIRLDHFHSKTGR
ncbi:hypothetical protein VNI00_007338 [Paramarasmius palmivorus]|uniref:Uncharacterized protein n=1 Tax=Paramarasmius palmivorus TaxID=297713 RepID=A0AAW0CZV9_9AGAR